MSKDEIDFSELSPEAKLEVIVAKIIMMKESFDEKLDALKAEMEKTNQRIKEITDVLTGHDKRISRVENSKATKVAEDNIAAIDRKSRRWVWGTIAAAAIVTLGSVAVGIMNVIIFINLNGGIK